MIQTRKTIFIERKLVCEGVSGDESEPERHLRGSRRHEDRVEKIADRPARYDFLVILEREFLGKKRRLRQNILNRRLEGSHEDPIDREKRQDQDQDEHDREKRRTLGGDEGSHLHASSVFSIFLR